MKKIILVILLFKLTQCANAAVVSTGSAVAIGAASGAAAASMSAQRAAQEAANQSMLVNAQAQGSGVASGVLICDAAKQKTPDGNLIMNGCDVGGAFNTYFLSIQDFFNRNKPSSASKITMVIYDAHNNDFQIYYN